MSPARDASRPRKKAAGAPRKRRPQARALATRDQIASAAIACFSGLGFDGATTRLIAEKAGVNQGLITHHFQNKEGLWRAAADRLFSNIEEHAERRSEGWEDADPATRVRLMIRHFVRYAAKHPEQLRFMMQEGLSSGPRMQWLVENHLAAGYARFETMLREARAEGMLIDGDDAHLFYAFVGAASTIFALAAECEHLTGMDPLSEANVERHAQLVERMLLVQR